MAEMTEEQLETQVVNIGNLYKALLEDGLVAREEVLKMLVNALGINRVLTNMLQTGNIPREELNAVVHGIHRVMGAPVYWGYHTELGKTLQKIYQP